jgi:serine/threonine-protein kinase
MGGEPNKIGRFEILGQLGKGGMGVVVKARDPNVNRIVAIKTIKNEAFGDPEQEKELIERFYREAKATAQLNHPNIVTLFEMGKEEDTTFIVMEFMEGDSLTKVLTGDKSPDLDTLIDYMRQISSGLDFAHSNGILHRDIKPANIMLTKGGTCKIADFGLARLSTASGITSTGRAVGSPSYMSPEQVQDQEVDGRSDQFSLGVMFYELLTGTRPFTGSNVSSVIYKIVRENPVPPTVMNTRLHPAIDKVVLKVLAKNPDSRYPTCTAFVDALARAVKGLEEDSGEVDISDTQTMVIDTSGFGKGAKKKSGLVWGLAAVVLLAAGGGAAYFMYGEQLLGGKKMETVAKVTPPPAATKPAPEPVPAPKQAAPAEAPVVPKAALAVVPAPKQAAPAEAPVVPKLAPAVEPAPKQAPPAVKAAVEKPAPKAPVMGLLSIVASGDAEVYVDGKLVGHGSVKKKKVAPGKHTLLVKREGYKDWKKVVRIAENEDFSIKAAAIQAKGTLKVSGPAGAIVSLNGKKIGTAPVTKDLPPGDYSVEVRLAGKKPWFRNVEIAADRTASLSPRLIEKTGRLTLVSTPQGRWFLDGKEMGKTPVNSKELPAGRHDIKVAAAGYKPVTRRIELPAGKSAKLDIQLQKLPTGSLAVSVSPWATIYLDGQKIGPAPQTIEDVTVGKHKLEFKNPNFKPYATTIELAEGENMEISHAFVPKATGFAAEGLKVGVTAPNIMGRTLGGKIYRLYKSEAKLKVLNFWWVRSLTSKTEMQQLAKLEKQYPGVEFISVHSVSVSREKIIAFLEVLSGSPSVIVMGNKKVQQLYKFQTIPHTVVLDNENRVLLAITGYTSENMKQLEEIIKPTS